MMDPIRIVWPRKGQVGLEAFEMVELGADQVLIETEYTLISPGTELAWLHAMPNTPGTYPQYPGYNNVGRVLKLGSQVSELSVGDRVVSPAQHASLVAMPATQLTRVPESVDSRDAAYFNMACISLQAVRKARLELGETVLVMGQGLIGNLALQLARLSGGMPVVVADLIAWRLELSRACGADLAVNPQEKDLKASIAELTGSDSADVVLDATGLPGVVLDCFDLAGYRGRVVLLASTRGETERVNFYRDVHRKGLIVIGAHNSVRPMDESTSGYWTAQEDAQIVLRLMAAGRLKISPLTTDVLKAENAPRAYELLNQARDEHLGVLLDWR